MSYPLRIDKGGDFLTYIEGPLRLTSRDKNKEFIFEPTNDGWRYKVVKEGYWISWRSMSVEIGDMYMTLASEGFKDKPLEDFL